MKKKAADLIEELKNYYSKEFVRAWIAAPDLMVEQPLFYRRGAPLHGGRIYLSDYPGLTAGPTKDASRVLMVSTGAQQDAPISGFPNLCLLTQAVPLTQLMQVLQSLMEGPMEKSAGIQGGEEDPNRRRQQTAFHNLAEEYLASRENSCGEAVLRMDRYDREHGTSFCVTFALYAKNRFNALQTARELFIHRSTLLYRLERMEKLFSLDLTNMDNILYELLFLKHLRGE